MNDHASMNRIYRLVWSQVRGTWIPVAETSRGRGKRGRAASRAKAVAVTVAALGLSGMSWVHAAPAGGQVVSGKGTITQSGSITDIHQSSQNLSIDWLSFNVAPQETVDFIQPSVSAVAVNRIGGNTGSEIMGHLESNGQVYLINPNGVLFGAGSTVNVGGLVASTLEVSDASSSSASRSFTGSGTGSVVNEGTITAAPGGSVALIGNHVSNQGVISAQLGTVAAGAGSAVTLTFAGDSLVHLSVDRSVLKSLAENHGLIQADGGRVLMTAGAKDALLASVVNNTGIIEARTVEDHAGTITLLGGMAAGTVKVGGVLDASAADGGDGGHVETSAAQVEVADNARITTAAARGQTGSWLIDPNDFTVAPSGGDITGAQLTSELAINNVTIKSSQGHTAGTGSINVDDTVSWKAHTLTLTAADNVDVNATMTASGTASLALNPATANGSEAATSGGAVLMGMNGSGFTGTVNFSGTGTLSIGGTPYTVINSLGAAGSTTGTDLQGINGKLGGHYVLGSNINASATSGWNSGAGFNPIGTTAKPFTGIFDALGHTIQGLFINRSTEDLGLFGAPAAPAVISNVGLVGGSVSGASYYVGGLAGLNGGAITNSFAKDAVKNSLGFVGGLVGYNEGPITNSYATGSVSSAGGLGAVGGLVGENSYAHIVTSYATGSVSETGFVGGVGGLVGYNFLGTIFNSHAMGSVSSAGGGVGGLVGIESSGSSIDGSASVIGSFATGPVSGGSGVGGLVGQMMGSAATVYGSYATGPVSGESVVGGLVGQIKSIAIVDNSYATGQVSGQSSVGGMVGENDGRVFNSYATGQAIDSLGSSHGGIFGGLVGINLGSIVDSYATGPVSGSSDVGGLVGLNEGTVQATYAKGQVSGSTNVGGLVGINDGAVTNSYWDMDSSGRSSSAGGTGLTNAQMLTASNFVGFTFTTTPGAEGEWVIVDADGTLNNSSTTGATFPMLTNEYSTTITNAHQLQLMAMNTNAAYTLAENINASGTSPSGTDVWSSGGFAPIGSRLSPTGPFSGSLDGQGHTITNLIINTSNVDAGLFGSLGVDGSVRNVGLIGGSVIGGSTVTSGSIDGVGALVGVNNGTVSNSYATGNFVKSNSTGFANVGGLVGNNFATILNSFAAGTVQSLGGDGGGLVGDNEGSATVMTSHATGTVFSNSSGGGLAGSNSGTISNSYATGEVIGQNFNNGGLVGLNYGAVKSSHATGAVTGNSYVGGLIGFNIDAGRVSNSYATGAVSGSSYVGGLVGYNDFDFGHTNISNSYATGAVTGSSYVGGFAGRNLGIIATSYSAGKVSGSTDVGGFSGGGDGTISASFWDKTTSGQSALEAGAIGMSTAEMQTEANFTSATSANGNVNPHWDFTNTWVMQNGKTFPTLR